MTTEEADAAVGDLPSCDVDRLDADATSAGPLPPEQIAALKLADVLTEPRTAQVDQPLMAELSEHFTAGQILELATALAVASGWQRFIEAFGIRPDHWTEATPLPPRPNDPEAD
ncbi:MAG: hypothetical protein OEV40_05105 [Acidimicrobiia bacterium]|nr:hypothetical protein [Acidimicrobiia bacterium]